MTFCWDITPRNKENWPIWLDGFGTGQRAVPKFEHIHVGSKVLCLKYHQNHKSRWLGGGFNFLFSPRSLRKWSTLTCAYLSKGWWKTRQTDPNLMTRWRLAFGSCELWKRRHPMQFTTLEYLGLSYSYFKQRWREVAQVSQGICFFGCWTKNRGVLPPKWMVKIRENPIKQMDDLGGFPIFLETPF